MERIAAGVPVPAPPADVRTVRAAASGDLAAFGVLAEARLLPSFRLAVAILGDAAEAGLAVQHALIAAWSALPRLDGPEGFDVWFRRLLVDECRMRLRQHAPSLRPVPASRPAPASPPSPASPPTLPPPPGSSDSRADAVDRAAVLDALEAALERLDPDDRAIVALHRLEERPAAEIAALLHLPAGTVKLRLHEAHATLVEALETV
jgi:RNA polymerase sigma-70 factor (ECF subfamily)